MILNKNKEHVLKIINAIFENDGYCPCLLIKDETTKCPCNNFTKNNECHCSLFVKEKECDV